MVELGRAGRNTGDLVWKSESTEQALRNWVKEADIDDGRRADVLASAEREELAQLRKEVRLLGASSPPVAVQPDGKDLRGRARLPYRVWPQAAQLPTPVLGTPNG